MKPLYKFIFITLLISSVFFLALNNFPNPNVDEVELNTLSNNSGICGGDSRPFHKPDHSETLNHDGWYLIWQEEFENNCLDSGNWNIEDWAAEKNNELQYYSPNNVKVEDGLLKLISKKERFRGRDYTSGAIQSKGKFSFLYGKVEMRAKLPAGQGIFPAFWMMPDKENTWLPEIDIMEMVGHQPNEVWMVSHWLSKTGSLQTDFSTFKGPDFSKDFHTFSIEWTPDSITWFIDNIERFQSSKFIPSTKMYLYLNTAIGGDWPKPPDHSTIFPVNYEIDYVRVFKRNKD